MNITCEKQQQMVVCCCFALKLMGNDLKSVTPSAGFDGGKKRKYSLSHPRFSNCCVKDLDDAYKQSYARQNNLNHVVFVRKTTSNWVDCDVSVWNLKRDLKPIYKNLADYQNITFLSTFNYRQLSIFGFQGKGPQVDIKT